MTIWRFYLRHFAPRNVDKQVSCVQFESEDLSAEKHAASECRQSRKLSAGYLTNFNVPLSGEGAAWPEGGRCMERQSERFKIHISRRQSTDRCLCKWSADGFISLTEETAVWHEREACGWKRRRAARLATAGTDNYWGLSFVWRGEHMEHSSQWNHSAKGCGDRRGDCVHVFTSIRQIIILMWKYKTARLSGMFYNQDWNIVNTVCAFLLFHYSLLIEEKLFSLIWEIWLLKTKFCICISDLLIN